MKENKPTNETGKNRKQNRRKRSCPLFQTLKTSTSKPLPNRGAGVQHHAFGTGENQYRRLQVDDEGGQERQGHQAPAALHHSQRAAQGSSKLTDFRKPIG